MQFKIVISEGKWLFVSTHTRVTHCSVAWVDDWAVKEDRTAELRGHVRLGVGELGLGGLVGQQEARRVVLQEEGLWKKGNLLDCMSQFFSGHILGACGVMGCQLLVIVCDNVNEKDAKILLYYQITVSFILLHLIVCFRTLSAAFGKRNDNLWKASAAFHQTFNTPTVLKGASSSRIQTSIPGISSKTFPLPAFVFHLRRRLSVGSFKIDEKIERPTIEKGRRKCPWATFFQTFKYRLRTWENVAR